MVIALFGAQLHRHNVRTGARLGHGQGPNIFPTQQAGQVFLFLLMGAVQLDLVHAQVGMRAIRQRNRRRYAGQFLDHDHMRQIGHPCPAVFFGNGDAQQAQFAKLFPQFVGEFIGAVDFGRQRLDPLLGKAMHHVAQGINIFAKIEIHRVREHGGSSPVY